MCWFFALLYFLMAAPLYAESINQAQEISILSLADIHFDPFISCRANTPCPLVQLLRAAPATKWPAILAKGDNAAPQYREDSNYALFISALGAAKQAAEKNKVKTVLVLGDYLGHSYRQFYIRYSRDYSRAGYQDFVHKTMMFLSNEIAKAFPRADVYSVLGNNDSYRGDYRLDDNGEFFKDTAQIFASLIKNPVNRAALKFSFPTAGYYAVMITPNTRLLVLNTVLFSTKAKLAQAQTLAQGELAWMHEQLMLAKNKNQHVMIAMHIPPGIDVYTTLKYRLFRIIEFWDAVYIKQFEADLREFSPEMVGIFASHLHSDWFQMLQIDNRNTIPVSGTPSISPLFGNNPGFKIYQYSPKEGELKNFETYYYPLDKQAAWGVEYSFDKIYQPNCSRCSLPESMERLTESDQLASYYKRFYAVSTESQPITTKWMPYYWCAIQTIDAGKYKTCIN